MAFLEVDNLELNYTTSRGPVRAVDSVSFKLEEPGQVVGIIGETGSGKSSLVMALTRILPRNVARFEGKVSLLGQELMGFSPEQFRRNVRWNQIAVVFQGSMNGFNPVIRVGNQLIERAVIEKTIKRPEAKARMEKILTAVGLPESTFDRFPHELSGGMKQRAAIAMALSLEPPLLILDEPTSALDVSVQAQIMNVLKRLKWERGLSMIFITHDIALASDLSDLIAVMYAGQIREFGTVEDVLKNPKDPYTQELLASIPLLHGGSQPRFVTGSPPDPITPPNGCRFHPRCPHAFELCRSSAPNLSGVPDGPVNHRARCWLLQSEKARQPAPDEAGK